MCVTGTSVDLNLAFEILECLDEVKPHSMLLGTYELIDRCLDLGHVEAAAAAYHRLHNAGHRLDVSGLDRLARALVTACRIDDLELALRRHSVTEDLLALAAEPLVLSGDLPAFAGLFARFLDQRGAADNALQCPDRVARVLQVPVAAPTSITPHIPRHVTCALFLSLSLSARRR
jgi:hypothetical protein